MTIFLRNSFYNPVSPEQGGKFKGNDKVLKKGDVDEREGGRKKGVKEVKRRRSEWR